MIMDFYDILDNIGYKEKYKAGSLLWSPKDMTLDVCAFLCEGGGKQILDVGSGVGRFCLEGAYYNPTCHFTGVELDEDRHNAALKVQDILDVKNASFIHSSFTEVDFTKYDSIFLFNPFNMGGHVVYNGGEALKWAPRFYDDDYTMETEMNDPQYLEYKEKQAKIKEYIKEMEAAFIEKVSLMRVGSRVSINATSIPLEQTGLFISNRYSSRYTKIK